MTTIVMAISLLSIILSMFAVITNVRTMRRSQALRERMEARRKEHRKRMESLR